MRPMAIAAKAARSRRIPANIWMLVGARKPATVRMPGARFRARPQLVRGPHRLTVPPPVKRLAALTPLQQGESTRVS